MAKSGQSDMAMEVMLLTLPLGQNGDHNANHALQMKHGLPSRLLQKPNVSLLIILGVDLVVVRIGMEEFR